MSEQQEANPQEKVNVSEQQLMAVKHALIGQILQSYQKFISGLKALPSASFQRQQAFINFDQGMLWMKEAIAAAQLEVKAVGKGEIPPQSEPEMPPEGEPVAPVEQPSARCDFAQEPAPESKL